MIHTVKSTATKRSPFSGYIKVNVAHTVRNSLGCFSHVKNIDLHLHYITYSITERRVPELIPVLGSQPAGDVSHKPGGRLPLLSARPAVTLATLKRAATSFAAW